MPGANGAGASKPSPRFATILRTSEKPFECTPDEARPITTSPARYRRAAAACRARRRRPRSPRDRSRRRVHAGHLGGLAADQRAAGLAAALGDALDDRGAGLGIELAAGEVVEEEQRLGALHDEVVDAHRDEIDADGVVQSGFDRDLELGADAVGAGDQHRILEAGALEVEQPAEAADFGVRAGARGRAHQRLDQVDQPVAGVDIDARVRVGEPVLRSVMAVSE